jgi:septation ring formation regulator EzrA
MTANDDNSNRAKTGLWVKTRNVIGLVILAAISYAMGLSHARSERNSREYLALKAQYDRMSAEYSASKAQYDRMLTEYSASKAQYDRMLTEYSARKAQYDRIEAQRTRPAMHEPKRQP